MKITVTVSSEEVGALVREHVEKLYPGLRVRRIEAQVAPGYQTSDPRESSYGPSFSGFDVELAR